METTKDSSPITISYWDKQYQDDFIRLNKEWIERYFCLEASDLKILSNPEKAIILTGGEIFFALENGKAVGCCALVHHPDSGRYELAKMAVSPSAQGKGIGFLLGSTLLSYARKQGITHLFLEVLLSAKKRIV